MEEAGRAWQIVFSSTSYAGTIAAIRAGMGITVLPRTMIPDHIGVIESQKLPPLSDTHVSLLKHTASNAAINSFEEFVLKKLRH